MPKYIVHGSFTLDGVKGLVKEGGTSRRAKIAKNVENIGGKLEAFYFAFGTDDVFTIIDMPDNISTAAISLAVSVGGGFHSDVIALLTPEEIDQAVKKVTAVGYTPPGQ